MTGAGKEGGGLQVNKFGQIWREVWDGPGARGEGGGKVEQVEEAWAGNRRYTSQLLYNVGSQATVTKFVFFRGEGGGAK